MAGLTASARRLGRGALDLLFPPACVACGASGAFLCVACAGRLAPAAWPRCRRCWRPLQEPGTCTICRANPPPFDGLRAAFVYDARARVLVHALKYRGMTALAPPMASLMARALRGSVEAEAIVPVPLAGRRRRTRGYNQAEVLARALGEELGLPVAPRALRRTRETAPQARAADSNARRRNVEGAFEAAADAAGRRLMLVDDVTTTGATLSACARALREAGAASVWAVAFARED